MNDMILILNYSDEFSREIALRLRGEQIYGRIVSGMTTSAQIADLQPTVPYALYCPRQKSVNRAIFNSPKCEYSAD